MSASRRPLRARRRRRRRPVALYCSTSILTSSKTTAIRRRARQVADLSGSDDKPVGHERRPARRWGDKIAPPLRPRRICNGIAPLDPYGHVSASLTNYYSNCAALCCGHHYQMSTRSGGAVCQPTRRPRLCDGGGDFITPAADARTTLPATNNITIRVSRLYLLMRAARRRSASDSPLPHHRNQSDWFWSKLRCRRRRCRHLWPHILVR